MEKLVNFLISKLSILDFIISHQIVLTLIRPRSRDMKKLLIFLEINLSSKFNHELPSSLFPRFLDQIRFMIDKEISLI